MRTALVLLLGSLTVALAGPACAASTAAGASILAIQLSRGVAEYAFPASGEIFNHSELGVQAQYWYFLREDYGVNFAAGIGYFKESSTTDPGILLGSSEGQTINSWQVRIGGDRFAKLSDKLHLFAGPGIGLWSGKSKFTVDGSTTSETPTVFRWTLSGRIGTHILMGENFGLIGQVGQYWGYATAEDGDGFKSKWLPSSSEGAMGFSFGF